MRENENRAQFAAAKLAAIMAGAADIDAFLPFPPPKKRLDIAAAERLLIGWVKSAGGEIISGH